MLSRSSTTASSATRTGSSSGKVTMPVPRRMRDVARGGMRQEHERRRQAAFGFVEMMLRDPGRIEAAALGLHDLRGRQPITLGGVRLVEQAREEPQTLRHAAKLARTGHSCKAKHISCVLQLRAGMISA